MREAIFTNVIRLSEKQKRWLKVNGALNIELATNKLESITYDLLIREGEKNYLELRKIKN